VRIVNSEVPECAEQAKQDAIAAAPLGENVMAGSGLLVKNQIAFSSAKFCMVPLGATGGDARRHMAGVAYGCVPVIVHDYNHMTYDELLVGLAGLG
jgi:hypothetical protein